MLSFTPSWPLSNCTSSLLVPVAPKSPGTGTVQVPGVSLDCQAPAIGHLPWPTNQNATLAPFWLSSERLCVSKLFDQQTCLAPRFGQWSRVDRKGQLAATNCSGQAVRWREMSHLASCFRTSTPTSRRRYHRRALRLAPRGSVLVHLFAAGQAHQETGLPLFCARQCSVAYKRRGSSLRLEAKPRTVNRQDHANKLYKCDQSIDWQSV